MSSITLSHIPPINGEATNTSLKKSHNVNDPLGMLPTTETSINESSRQLPKATVLPTVSSTVNWKSAAASNVTTATTGLAHNLRGRITHELREIEEMIKSSGFTDEMTVQVTLWRNNFANAFSPAVFATHLNSQDICRQYIQAMQELLYDHSGPLDEKAHLGSDGKTYGNKSLSLYLYDEKPINTITYKPHVVVRHMIKWLEKHKARLYSADIENRYDALCAANALPMIPTLSVQEDSKELSSRVTTTSRAKQSSSLAELKEKLRRVREEKSKSAKAGVEEANKRQKDFSATIISRVQRMSQVDDTELTRLEQGITRLSTEVAELDVRILSLEKNTHALQAQVQETELRNLKLQRELKTTQLSIKQYKKKQQTDAGLMFGKIAFCAFVSWALKIAIAPTSSGLSITFPL